MFVLAKGGMGVSFQDKELVQNRKQGWKIEKMGEELHFVEVAPSSQVTSSCLVRSFLKNALIIFFNTKRNL